MNLFMTNLNNLSKTNFNFVKFDNSNLSSPLKLSLLIFSRSGKSQLLFIEYKLAFVASPKTSFIFFMI